MRINKKILSGYLSIYVSYPPINLFMGIFLLYFCSGFLLNPDSGCFFFFYKLSVNWEPFLEMKLKVDPKY